MYGNEIKGCAQTAPRSPSPVDGAMVALRDQNQRLAQLVGILQSRLEPALGPSPESACRSGGRLNSCPLEGAINGEAEALSDSADRLSELLDRLQL